MKKIELSQQGKNKDKFVALVDDWNYENLNQWRWQAHKERKTYYAVRTIYPEKKTIRMHNVIMNPLKGMLTDHEDHHGLNNQEYNLRNCNRSQNGANRIPSGKSKYLGVYFNNKSIRASITVNNKCIKLGNFKTEELAAKAYDNAALKYHGEFANLNFSTVSL